MTEDHGSPFVADTYWTRTKPGMKEDKGCLSVNPLQDQGLSYEEFILKLSIAIMLSLLNVFIAFVCKDFCILWHHLTLCHANFHKSSINPCLGRHFFCLRGSLVFFNSKLMGMVCTSMFVRDTIVHDTSCQSKLIYVVCDLNADNSFHCFINIQSGSTDDPTDKVEIFKNGQSFWKR